MTFEIRDSTIRDITYGEGVVIMQPSNVYEAILGDDVFVGPFCEIQRGASIGHRTRVQSHSFICELVTAGEDCFIGHGVMFVNDRMRGDRRMATGLVGNQRSLEIK